MDERLSASLDNEASRDDVDAMITAALADPGTRACWTRHYWVRAALQAGPDEAQPRLDAGFADRVMAALPADGQVATAPTEPANDDASSVIPLSARKPRHTNRTAWRNGFGAAAAASVVGVVVFAYAPVGTHDAVRNAGHVTRDTVATQSMAAGVTQTVAGGGVEQFESSERRAQPDATWSVSNPALRRELNSYLVEHHGLARTFGFAASSPSLVQSVAYSVQPSR